jgi:copper chaperone CopZ
MEKIQWKVDGMDCSNCALTIRKYLEKQGMQDVKVNFATGDVSFDVNGNSKTKDLVTGIKELGYTVTNHQHEIPTSKTFFYNTSSALFILFTFYTGISSAYDTWRSYSLADESMGSIGTDDTSIHSRNEFFWKKCMEKFTQWHT